MGFVQPSGGVKPTHQMLFLRVFLIISLLSFSCHVSFAREAEKRIDAEQETSETEEEIRLVSPIGAMVRSAIFPGWGQFYSRSYFRGSLTALGVGSSVIGALLAQRSFNNRYNAYATYASLNPHDEVGVLERYAYANQRYKLRMFFMYTGIGIWVYSLIDSYVSSNFYNATTLVKSIQKDAQEIEKLGIEVGATPSHLYLGIVKTF